MGDNPGEIGLALASVTLLGLIIVGGILMKVMKELGEVKSALSKTNKSTEL